MAARLVLPARLPAGFPSRLPACRGWAVGAVGAVGSASRALEPGNQALAASSALLVGDTPACASAPARLPVATPVGSAGLHRCSLRRFATAAFSVAANGQSKAQALFVIGLNEGKFFGQDSAEEGLKLIERVATHHPDYQLLFSLTEKELAEVENDHKVKNQRLTASRELESARHGEMVPLVQAGMVDKRPRKALGRPVKLSQVRVAWLLWKHPREAVQVYWAYWRRKEHKDAARSRFWLQHFPVSAAAHFEERAELVAIRAVEHLLAIRVQGEEGAAVLVVGNELFGHVVQQLRTMLGEDAPAKLADADFQRKLRETAAELCVEVPDLTPLLVFIYLGIPLLGLQFVGLAVESYVNSTGLLERVMPPEEVRE